MKTIPFSPIEESSYPIGLHIDEAINYIEKITPFIKDIILKGQLNIWCQGSSGAILAALLSKSLPNKCYINHIKKEGEYSHHGNYDFRWEGYNMILDDFIRSGETIEHIYKFAKNHTDVIDILCVANFMYDFKLLFQPNYFISDKDSFDKWGNKLI